MITTAPPAHAMVPNFFSSAATRTNIPIEVQHTETVANVQTEVAPKTRGNNANTYFADFKKQLRSADTSAGKGLHNVLLDVYETCGPKANDNGEFSMLVRRYLSSANSNRARTPDRHIVACLNSPHAHLPPIYSPGAWEILRSLEKMSAASFDCTGGIRQLYKKYGTLATQSAHKSISADQDKTICLLIRGVWTVNLNHTRGSTTAQGDSNTAHDWDLLRDLSQQLSNPNLGTHLTSLFENHERVADQLVSFVTLCTTEPEMMSMGINVLKLIPRPLLKASTTSVCVQLIGPRKSVSNLNLQHLEMWLGMLRTLDSKATNVSEPDLASQTLVDLFQNYCAFRYPPRVIVTALLYALAGHKSMTGGFSDRLANLTRSYAPILRQQQAENLSLNNMLARLIFELRELSIPNHGVLELMVPLLHDNTGIQSVLDLLRRVKSSGSVLSQTTFLENYMAQAVDSVSRGDQSNEYKRQRTASALWTCQQIHYYLTYLGANVRTQAAAVKAIQALQARRQLLHIIHRAQDAHIVPLAYRNVTCDISRSTQTDLMHQFAHQYALDRTRSHRQSWRSIYYLYKYMRQQKLEIGPLFSKAVVQVCIIQPLSENHFVSSRRLIWVCQLVAQVEGVEVAKKIEHIFWIWRGNLILHAKSTWNAAGADGRAHIATLKRLGMI
jgi:hypothetical protein